MNSRTFSNYSSENSKKKEKKFNLKVIKKGFLLLSTLLRWISTILIFWSIISMTFVTQTSPGNVSSNYLCPFYPETKEIKNISSEVPIFDFDEFYNIIELILNFLLFIITFITICVSILPYYLSPLPIGKKKMFLTILPLFIYLIIMISINLHVTSLLHSKNIFYKNFCHSNTLLMITEFVLTIDIFLAILGWLCYRREKKKEQLYGKVHETKRMDKKSSNKNIVNKKKHINYDETYLKNDYSYSNPYYMYG